MTFYEKFTITSTGDAVASMEEFNNLSQGTEVVKNDGSIYIKTTRNVWEKSERATTLVKLGITEVYTKDEIDTKNDLLNYYNASTADNRFLQVQGDTFEGNFGVSVDNTFTIGSSASKFATIYATTFDGTATSAEYADLAEKYEPDTQYPVGTVVEIGGSKEITVFKDGALAGIISELPGFRLNEKAGDNYQFVALKGKVPAICNGDVKKGQYCIARNGAVIGVDKADLTDDNKLNICGVALEDSKNNTVQVKV